MTHFLTGYTQATVCLPVRDGQVFLAEKQGKIGAGRLNGFGGRREPEDATIQDTNIREVQEEVGITVTRARQLGDICFHNPSQREEALRRMQVHFFVATQWLGEPRESEEMKNFAWHDIDGLDYSQFMPGDRLFLPAILGGQSVRGLVAYDEQERVVMKDLSIVKKL